MKTTTNDPHTPPTPARRPAKRTSTSSPSSSLAGRKPNPAASRARKLVQGELPLKTWGGRRQGAGRPPKGDKPGIPHGPRKAHASWQPAFVTVKLREGLPRLRARVERSALFTHFARGKDRFGFRLLHFAILNDHLHFVVEARDRVAFTRGMKGLLVRIARGLNKLWRRKGQVFPDRFHERALKSPREVRNAIVYVLGNGKKHAAQGRAIPVFSGPDPFTSAPWFDGFVEELVVINREKHPLPVVAPRTWLAGVGWKRHGKIGFDEMPQVG